MVFSANREPLRGVAERVLDRVFEAVSSHQWAQLLRDPLEHAAGDGDHGLVHKLMQAGAEAGCALHKAVVGRHVDTINSLLENGAPINEKGGYGVGGYTPLHVAAEAGDAEMIQLLLIKGAAKDELGSEGRTALHVAVEHGHVAATICLLAAGVDTGIRRGLAQRKKLPLHIAVEKGHEDVSRALIEHGVNVGARDSMERTALHYCIIFGKLGIIDVLIDAGADVEARDIYLQTPLYFAAGRSDQGVVLALLRHGADVCAETTLGDTPLHHACWRGGNQGTTQGTAQVMEVLLKHGAEVNAKNKRGDTPLHKAAWQAGKQGTAQAVDVLLRWGADETTEDGYGKRPADVIGKDVEEQDRLAGDVEHVQKLLANAPADRAWRRRGYLTMCRAHPDRMKLKQERRATDTDMRPKTRSRTKVARIEESSMCGLGGGSIKNERAGGNWMHILVKVFGFEEEGIFRAIVGYL